LILPRLQVNLFPLSHYPIYANAFALISFDPKPIIPTIIRFVQLGLALASEHW